MFYITVSNGLLEGDHQKKMASAVWQFMWCLDKLTSINEEGEGKVLGGKPIKLTDIHGSSERTNSRNLNKLEKMGYIKLIHTPYGISIRVMKAKKKFGRRDDNNGVPNRSAKSGVPLTKNGVPNKTLQLDTTVDNAATSAAPFNFKEYLKELENHKARHINVIGHYFEEKKITFDTRLKANTAIKRHLRAAREVANFSDQEIVKATSEAKKQYGELWTVETILKMLTR